MKMNTFRMDKSEVRLNKAAFVDELNGQKVVLFVGAGLSRLIGKYKAWKGFLCDIAEASGCKCSVEELVQEHGYLKAADVIRDNAKDQYTDSLRLVLAGYEQIEQYINAQLHYRLLRLPFSGIVTTNYDRILENVIHRFIARQDRPSEPKPLSPAGFNEYAMQPTQRTICLPVNLCDPSDYPRVHQHVRNHAYPVDSPRPHM